jgi:hypothetical protein
VKSILKNVVGLREIKMDNSYPITYDPTKDKWITYSGEFSSFSEALQSVKN